MPSFNIWLQTFTIFNYVAIKSTVSIDKIWITVEDPVEESYRHIELSANKWELLKYVVEKLYAIAPELH